MNLSEEQKRKIEENRRRAMQLRLNRTSSGSEKLSDIRVSSASLPVSTKPLPRSTVESFFDKNKFSSNNAKMKFQPQASMARNKNQKDKFASKFQDKKQEWKKGKSDTSKTVTLTLCSRSRFEATSAFHHGVIETFKGMSTRSYDPVTKKWSFSIDEHDPLAHRLQGIPGIVVNKLPKTVLKMFLLHNKSAPKSVPEADLSGVDEKLKEALMPFQREGVNCGVAYGGRILLADDMGLGKTIQAICLACYYRRHWPLLIVTPSSVRYAWMDQVLRWVPSVEHSDVFVVDRSKDFEDFNVDPSILIMSYDLLSKNFKELSNRHFKIIIMDESHLLKNIRAARTKAAMPLLTAAQHVFLLSGTPALSRPSELYGQVTAIMPSLFRCFHDFGLRYCDAKEMPWGWDYSGCSNMVELQLILEDKVMIRRTKEEVLTQLPEKRREMIILDPNSVKKSTLDRHAKSMLRTNMKGMERRGALLEYFHETAKAKLPAVKQYVLDMLEADKKFLIFAHHQEVLDVLEEELQKKEVEYVRVDGRTPSERRQDMVERFQLYSSVKVALLSITAASSGINLTSASLVVFAELFWNPGILVQAEDRVYRIGQRNCVCVQYLVANGTSDDYICPLVQEKMEVLGKAGLNKENFRNADTTQLGAKEKKILDYFKEDFLESDEISEASKSTEEASTASATQGTAIATSDIPKKNEKSLFFVTDPESAARTKSESQEDIVIVPESPEAFVENLSDWDASDKVEETSRQSEDEKTLVGQSLDDEEDFDLEMANMASEVEKTVTAKEEENFDWMNDAAEWNSDNVVETATNKEEGFDWLVDDDDEDGWCGKPAVKRPRLHE